MRGLSLCARELETQWWAQPSSYLVTVSPGSDLPVLSDTDPESGVLARRGCVMRTGYHACSVASVVRGSRGPGWFERSFVI